MNKTHKKHYSTKRHRKTFRKLNCHPSLSKKKVLDHSCLTSEALTTLKNTYNNQNPNNLISTNDPKEIWNQLHEKIPHCDQETCWIQNIPDKNLQTKMKRELFTPFQPSDWKHNKNAWLSNFDIAAVLKQYEETYHTMDTNGQDKKKEFLSLGPTPIDFDTKKTNGQCVWNELCQLSLSNEYNKGTRKIGIIYNLDTHKGTGTHWVSMFIDMTMTNNNEKPFIFYFNSTSQRMPKQIHDLIARLQKQWMEFQGTKFQVYKNTKVSHQRTDSECGMYSLFFIITCLTRKTDLIPDKILTITDLVELFARKYRIDDKYVSKFREIYFNPSHH